MKKILCALILMVATFTVSAQEKIPFFASWNKAGQMNLSATVGWYGWGIDASAGGELIMGDFEIATIPLNWGIMAKGLAGMDVFWTGGFSIGAAAAATLHWGFIWGIDVYIGLGAGVCITPFTPFGIGIASLEGASWKLTDNLSLLVDWAYVNPFLSAGLSAFGLGVLLKI